MRIAIIGTGSLGLAYGSFLSKVSDCTVFTRRAEQAEAINRDGVVVLRNGESTDTQVAASTDPDLLADKDVIFVLTKAYDAEVIARLLQKHAPSPVIVSMQSGLGALDYFNSFCGTERVLAAISYLGAKRTSDTSVELGENLRTVIGEQDGSTTPRLMEMHNLLASAGLETEVSPSVEHLIWEKMVVIVAQQALSALTGCTFGELRSSDQTTSVIEPLLTELEAVAHKLGISYDGSLIDRVHTNWESLPNHRSSMWLDLQTPGKRTEVDFINGAVVRLGAEHGISTPANALMQSLIHLRETNQP